jgi:alpha-beta hydrolase superfamily lysophospholipase
MSNKSSRTSLKRRLVFVIAAAGTVGFVSAYRFALRYRERAGTPHRSPVEGSPADFGFAFETISIPSGDLLLAGWFVPAGTKESTPEPGSAVVVVHGWESNRGRTFAHVRYLHAAGFHCLVFDVRGHGDSPDDGLPVNTPEFAEDTAAAVRWLAARPETTRIGVLGHSMGAAGAILAASREPLISAVVSMSAPADLARITRKTFDLAEMNIPEPIATPLAYFTAALMLAPRRHSLDDASATVAAARYRGPLLLVHGAQDQGVPVEHLEIIARAAFGARGSESAPVDTLVLPDFGHRWLYEDTNCRRRVAGFLARSLGGPEPAEAGERAAGCEVKRPDDPVYGFGAMAGKAPPESGPARTSDDS